MYSNRGHHRGCTHHPVSNPRTIRGVAGLWLRHDGPGNDGRFGERSLIGDEGLRTKLLRGNDMDRPIYLDFNATTPIDYIVTETMLPYLETHFGNPSTTYVYGQRTREAVNNAREQVASLIGAKPGEIVFTSGGSEGDNHAIARTAPATTHKRKHIIPLRI